MNEKNINPNETSKSIVLIANTSWYLYNFRKELISDLKAKGYDIYIISPEDSYSKHLIKISHKKLDWKLNRSSLNIFNEIISVLDLINKLREINPILIHNFTIKGSIYGSLAAYFTGNPIIINSITGLGHLFISNSFHIRLIRFIILPLLKRIFYFTNSKFIFQNDDDQNLFLKKGIINKKDSIVIKSSGVNTKFFKPDKLKKNNQYTILFPARIIKEKGIDELLMACKSLWHKGYKFKLYIAGNIDTGNRSSLSKKEFSNIERNPNIKCLGHIKDMKKIYNSSDLVVLPSWREGLSRTLLEASSMEKAIITTNVPGCRDLINHNKNGLLVNLKDFKDIERRILFLYKNRKIAAKLGKEARIRAINKFDVNIINSQTISFYSNFMKEDIM